MMTYDSRKHILRALALLSILSLCSAFPMAVHHSPVTFSSQRTMTLSSIPFISSPADIDDYEFNTTGNSITWTVESSSPDVLILLRDGTAVETRASWSNGSQVFDIDYLPALSTYNYTLVVNTTLGEEAKDTVLVTVVDTIAPTIQPHEDVYIARGTTGNEITWICSDPNPKRLMILRDSTLVLSQDWDGQNVTVSIDGLSIGSYDYHLYLWDNASTPNQSSLTTPVTVFNETLPFIYPVATTLLIVEGSGGSSLDWDTVDDNRDIYRVYIDEVMVYFSTWTTGDITYSLAGLSYRASPYNFTLEVMDMDGHRNTSTVMVTVQDLSAPVVQGPSSSSIEYGATLALEWSATELHPSAYVIYLDEVMKTSQPWDGDNITYSFLGESLGMHTITLSLFDDSLNSVNSTVDITVIDSTSPEIQGDAILETSLGVDYSVNWTVEDPFLDHYLIYQNNTLVEDGVAISTIQYEISSLQRTTLNLTLWVNDTSSTSAFFTTLVSFKDRTPPVISGPAGMDVNLTESSLLHIEWSPSDAYPHEYQVYVDSQPAYPLPLAWDGSTIVFETVLGAVAVYNVTLVVWDIDGNHERFVSLVTAFESSGTANTQPPDPTNSTTTPTDPGFFPASLTIEQTASIGLASLLLVAVVIYRKRRSGTASSDLLDTHPPTTSEGFDISTIETKRGTSLKAGKFVFKVKVTNSSSYTITDLKVSLLSYPDVSLKCANDSPRAYPKLESGAEVAPEFEFSPIRDCVQGDIKALVGFQDHTSKPHSLHVEPYTIKAVCPLLQPDSSMSDIEYASVKFQGYEQDQVSIILTLIDPETVKQVVTSAMKDSNFHVIGTRSLVDEEGRKIGLESWGWAKGKYTEKNIGVLVSTKQDPTTGAFRATISVGSPLPEMVPIALEEIRARLESMMPEK